LPWAGQEKYAQKNENFADRKASYQMAKLYDILVNENPNIYDDGGHNLNTFLSRLLFCFFAEDTDIFPIEGMFTNTLGKFTEKDGSDTHTFLDRLFKVLNTKDNSKEASHFKEFPYVNGGLFRDIIVSPKFTREARKIIIECGDLDWSEINPDIFGSMIQAVVNPTYRSGLGMHYTSVPNIMKVIEPLFLNELYEEFEKHKGKSKKLRQLIYRISKLKIFDPACGSGNFLIIAYKELRKLEIEIIKELNGIGQTEVFYGSQSKIHFTKDGYQVISDAPQSKINFGGAQIEIWFTEIKLSQFYGIELDDFAHEMAILSLWLAEHQMNKEFVNELQDFGKAKPILPLKEAGHITQGNATRLNWEDICSKDKNDEIYILGNPPYLGGKSQSKTQKEDMTIVFHNVKKFKELDYICCWFVLGSKYILNFHKCKLAFVTTSSINQGAQVEQLWPIISNHKNELFFAYKPFTWNNNAKGNAGVTVSILGLSNKSNSTKYIYENNIKNEIIKINGYLTPNDEIYVSKRPKPFSGLPIMITGNSPYEGGNLMLTNEEKMTLLNSYPEAEKLIRRAYGANEFIKNIERYCLWINDEDLNLIEKIPPIKERIEKIKELRMNGGDVARGLAKRSHKFRYTHTGKTDVIIVPIVSSGRREYIPIGFLSKESIVLSSAAAIYNTEPYVFGIVCSKLHMLWVEITAGKLRGDFRYLTGLTYNTFPFPEISPKQKEQINLHVFEILEQREKHSGKTMAQLYDPNKMPKGLKEAHHQLDLAIERCYRLKPFESDTERLEYLFKEYEKMINKNTLLENPRKTRKKKK
jgi:hypothetical protein